MSIGRILISDDGQIYIMSEHKCGACGVVLNSAEELKEHMLQMHSQ